MRKTLSLLLLVGVALAGLGIWGSQLGLLRLKTPTPNFVLVF